MGTKKLLHATLAAWLGLGAVASAQTNAEGTTGASHEARQAEHAAGSRAQADHALDSAQNANVTARHSRRASRKAQRAERTAERTQERNARHHHHTD